MVFFPAANVYGMALNLETSTVGVVLFGSDYLIKEHFIVTRLNKIVSTKVGFVFAGRIINPLGYSLLSATKVSPVLKPFLWHNILNEKDFIKTTRPEKKAYHLLAVVFNLTPVNMLPIFDECLIECYFNAPLIAILGIFLFYSKKLNKKQSKVCFCCSEKNSTVRSGSYVVRKGLFSSIRSSNVVVRSQIPSPFKQRVGIIIFHMPLRRSPKIIPKTRIQKAVQGLLVYDKICFKPLCDRCINDLAEELTMILYFRDKDNKLSEVEADTFCPQEVIKYSNDYKKVIKKFIRNFN